MRAMNNFISHMNPLPWEKLRPSYSENGRTLKWFLVRKWSLKLVTIDD